MACDTSKIEVGSQLQLDVPQGSLDIQYDDAP